MKKLSEDHMILAVHVTNRLKQAARVQEILTQYGKHIKTRIGLHEANGRATSPNGLIILEFIGSEKCMVAAQSDLNAVTGVEARNIVFEH